MPNALPHGNLLPEGEAKFNECYHVYGRNAAKANRNFELTKEQARELFQSNCKYCGMPPNTPFRRTRIQHSVFLYNGIDRVDNAVGYIASNCVPCCRICNHMKHVLSEDDFLKHIAMIYEHQKG